MLSQNLVPQILDHLGLTAIDAPTLENLKKLVDGYIRHVPWESASRIVRRANTQYIDHCPRWPNIFWESAIHYGTGGTCFESNYAFFHLLQHLGYSGYLTINNMGESIACHTALVIELDNQRYLVDAGLPLVAPLRIDPLENAVTSSEFHTYTLIPEGHNTYTINRDNHLRTYCFTLIDTPIDEVTYREATTNDYDKNGHFLDQVIVTRVVEGRQWRFKAEGEPYQLESFYQGDKTLYYLGDDVEATARQVASKFEMSPDIVLQAMSLFPRV